MSDHGIDFIDKRRRTAQAPAPVLRPNTVESMVASDIKTNVVGKSCVVNKNGKGQHIPLKNVRSWGVEGNNLVISTVDQDINIILTFTTSAEAVQGELRFASIFNGALLL
jgi:hypothetical protein